MREFFIKGKTEHKSCARHESGQHNMKTTFAAAFMVLCIFILLQSCITPKPTIDLDNLEIRAANLSATGNGQREANNILKESSITTYVGVDLTVTFDKESANALSVSMLTLKGNELLVKPGEEIELSFCPSCAEETEAMITLPDGSIRKVTASSPSFRWNVPEDITEPLEITGLSRYETKAAEYVKSGVIRLIPVVQ